jgi:hypothetical protein
MIQLEITIDGHRNWSDAAGELRGEGFQLGQDAEGFDLWRAADGAEARIRWHNIPGEELGRFVIERAAPPSAPEPEPEPEPAATFTLEELNRIGWAVQWAGSFATTDGGPKAGGPAFSSISDATELLERRGVHIFHNEETRRTIDATRQMEHERELAEAAVAGTADTAPDWAKPGAVWFCSWGYDQTNVDFYRVVKLAGAWITLEKIAATEHSDDTPDRPATFTGRAVPADPARPIGKPFRRKLALYTSGPFVKIESYSHAQPWDGTPKRTSSYA